MRLNASVLTFSVLLLTAVNGRGDVSRIPRRHAILGFPSIDAALQERNLLITLTTNSDWEANQVAATPLKLRLVLDIHIKDVVNSEKGVLTGQ